MPLENVAICACQRRYQAPRDKIHPKAMRKGEGKERGERERKKKKTSVPNVFIPSSLETVSEREKKPKHVKL